MTTPNNHMPEFKSRDEEAAWFERHMEDIWPDAKPVTARFAKNRPCSSNGYRWRNHDGIERTWTGLL